MHVELEKQIHELEKTKFLLKNSEAETKQSQKQLEEINDELQETKNSIQLKPEITATDILKKDLESAYFFCFYSYSYQLTSCKKGQTFFDLYFIKNYLLIYNF